MLVARQHTVVGHVGDVLASEVGELPASEAVPSPALQVRGEMRRVVDDLRQVTAIYFCSVLHPPLGYPMSFHAGSYTLRNPLSP